MTPFIKLDQSGIPSLDDSDVREEIFPPFFLPRLILLTFFDHKSNPQLDCLGYKDFQRQIVRIMALLYPLFPLSINVYVSLVPHL